MAKTERGQIANSVLVRNLGSTSWLLGPTLFKSAATQWFFGGPGISAVGDNDIEDNETSVIVYGHDFGDTQGSGVVELGDDPVYATANKISQTVTAWSESQITITIDLGSQTPGVKYFFVTDGASQVSQPKTCWVHRATAIKLQTSTNISAGAADATTNRLTAPTGTFVAGDRTDDTNPTPTITFTSGQFTEEELSFLVTTGAINGQSYEFRLVETLDDGTVVLLDDYAVTPEITLGSTPIQGTVRFITPVVARVTNTKIASSSIRGVVPITATATTTKIGSGTVRVVTPVTANTTGTKIGLGTVRTLETIVGLITGAPVTNLVQGTVRLLVPITARITGTKIASSTANVQAPIVGRFTTTKIANSSGRFVSPIVGRITNIKIGLTSVIAATPITARATGVKTALGSSLVIAPIVSRITGAKTLAQGTVRFVASPVISVTGAKFATSSVRFVPNAIGLIQGTSSNAFQSSTRFAFTVLGRITGTKVATTASTKFLVQHVAKTTGTKIINGSVLVEAPIAIRVPGRKIASGSVTFTSPTIVTASGRHITLGSVRLVAGITYRTTGVKTAAGTTRFYHNAILSGAILTGDPLEIYYFLRVLDRVRMLQAPVPGELTIKQPEGARILMHNTYNDPDKMVGPGQTVEIRGI